MIIEIIVMNNNNYCDVNYLQEKLHFMTLWKEQVPK